MAYSVTIFSIHFNHGGKLHEREQGVFYDGGNVTPKHGFDPDRFGYFDLVDEVEKLGYSTFDRLGFQVPGSDGEVWFVKDDNDVIKMLEYIHNGNVRIILYVDGGKKIDKGGITSCQTEGGGTNDGEIVGGGTYDSEDEDNDPEYEPDMRSEDDTDDELDDTELVSDDEEYISARQKLAKYKKNVCADDVYNDLVVVSECEESKGKAISVFTCEDIEAGDKGCNQSKPKHIRYDPKCDHNKFNFELGMTFDDAKQCREAVQKYGISQGYPISFIRSSNTQVEVHCEDGCMWKMYGSEVRGEKTFLVKTFYGEHTCHRKMTNKLAKSDWIATTYLEKFRRTRNWSVDDLQHDLLTTYALQVPRTKCYRAKWKALSLLRGSVDEHYAQLRNYQAELIRVDRRGRFETLLDDDGCLKGFFIGFSSLVQGFLKGCRPIVGFDGCFLKTFLGGALLAAVGKDGNSQMYPICWAVVEAENEFYWTWFMKLVFEELNVGDGLGWSFISDQQKGLLNAIKKLVPFAEGRNCARHVYCNWKKECKGQVLKSMFWRVVFSTYEAEYNANLDDLRTVDEAAYQNFVDRDPTKWCKLFVNMLPKCDMVDNNICETFNGFIVKARSKHIIDMLEEIRCDLMERQHTKLTEMSGVNDIICPIIRRKLEKNKYQSRNCGVKPAIGDKFQVSIGGDQFVVDLNKSTCTCRAWEISGIPCIHACSSIHFLRQDTVHYVHAYYSIAKYMEAYSVPLEPINGMKMWPQAEGNPIKPPPHRVMPGRPKKKRRRQPEENKKDPRKLTKHGVRMSCSKCGGFDHNMRSCTNVPKLPKAPAKRGRPKKQSSEGTSTETGSQNRGRGGGGAIRRGGGGAIRRGGGRGGGINQNLTQANELRHARSGYGLLHSESGRVYLRVPGAKRTKCVSGARAAAMAAQRSARSVPCPSAPSSNLDPALPSNMQPSQPSISRGRDQSSQERDTLATQESRVLIL